MVSLAVRIAYGENPHQFGELRLPTAAGKPPVVMMIHGGFWQTDQSLTELDKAAEDLTARGYATWNIEYRRVGQEGGGFPGTLLDVAAAAERVAGIDEADSGRMVVLGHGAGAHLGLWLAGRANLPPHSPFTPAQPLALRGVVSLAGITDLYLMWALRLTGSPVTPFLGGAPPEVPDRLAHASPIRLLPPTAPTVLIHGTADEEVPILLSQYYEAKAGSGAVLHELRGAGHGELITPGTEAWQAVVDVVRSLM